MAEGKESVRERQHTGLRPPRKYNVLIHNDDFTPMDFVVSILRRVFGKELQEAVDLMLRVHHSEKAVAGTYSRDVALSKADKATRMARGESYPLRLSCEPAEEE